MVKPKRRKTEKKKPPTELLDMHDDILEKVVKFCDFPSSQVLRRTNHRLQTIVSVVNPRTHIHEIYVEFVHDNLFRLGILLNRNSESTKFYPEGTKILVEYSNLNQRCIVKLNMERGRKGVIRLEEKGLACKDVFLSDLKSVLTQMDGPCDIFRVDAENKATRDFFSDVIETIPARKVVLKVNYRMDDWLSKFQPGTLTHIHLIFTGDELPMEISAFWLTQLEQWNQAEHLVLDHFTVIPAAGRVSIRNFLHFNSMTVKFGSFNTRELIALKNDHILHIDQPKNREIYLSSLNFADIKRSFGPQIPDKETPKTFPIHQQLKDLSQSEMDRYFARPRPAEQIHVLGIAGVPQRFQSCSYYFNVPGRDVVLRMRFLKEVFFMEELGKVEFTFVPRNGVDEDRIIHGDFPQRDGLNAQL